MSDYTPSLLVGQNYYVTGRAQIQRQITGEHAQDITPYSAEFNRMIAQVRAEALREFADRYQDEADWRTPADIDPDLIREVADRIEKEAGA